MSAAAQPLESVISPEHQGQMLRWRESFLTYGREVMALREYMPGRILTPDQEELLRLVQIHKRVACTSGNGTGKSYALALLVHWFLTTNPNSRVITTSASWELVEKVLWSEIRDMYMRTRIPLGGTLLNTELKYGEKWLAHGLSTDNPTRFQGKHAGRVLIIGDESTGIDATIFEAAEFMAIGPQDRLVFVGNPTDPSSDFYEECYRKYPGKWVHHEISCLNHPNVVYRKVLIPGACTYEQVEEQRKFLGEDHPTWEARILGRWPKRGGRMFADWDAKRHVYDPSKITLPAYVPRWIVGDWGFAHNAAFLFMAYDGYTTYVEDELVINEKTAGELGALVGSMANPERIFGMDSRYTDVYLAHDMFSRAESFRTRAEQFDDEAQKYGLPAGLPAAKDRIGGFNLITALLRTDRLKVSSRCTNLISQVPLAMRDPKKPEDLDKKNMEAKGGDDAIDALYKGVLARPTQPQLPRELRLAQQVTSTDPHTRAMQARLANSKEDDISVLGYVPRRSGRRWES
jgi:hypothetical protein